MPEEAADLAEESMELSQVGKTIDGEGYAYFQLDCVGKRVGSIALLQEYSHLRQIDLSRNFIVDVSPVAKLGHVLKLNLSSNLIESIDSWGPTALCHLLYLDLSSNRLKALPRLHLPALKRATFARNLVATCADFRGHGRLRALDVSGNRRLDSLAGLRDMPLLETLNVAENALPGLGGMRALPALKALDVSRNTLESLEGPWEETPGLQSLVASQNRIASTKAFEPLSRLPDLRRIEVVGNPLEEEEGVDVRLEVIICHRQVEAINGEEVTEDEREEARVLYHQRIEEERERQRQAAAAEAVA